MRGRLPAKIISNFSQRLCNGKVEVKRTWKKLQEEILVFREFKQLSQRGGGINFCEMDRLVFEL